MMRSTMTSQLEFVDMLSVWTLPYLAERSSGRDAMSALTTAVRAAVLHHQLVTSKNAAARAWWYRGGWPARVAVTSADDVQILVHAGVTNVVDVSFCGCDVPEVYALAATHFSTTTEDLRHVHLSDATSEHVARFVGLQALHCSVVSCGQLRTLSSCLTRLERLEVDTFDAFLSVGVLDDMAELFPALRAFPVLHALPPQPTNDGRSSLFALGATRLALRLLQDVPRWSRDHDLHTEGVLQSYNWLVTTSVSYRALSPHFSHLNVEIVGAMEAMAYHATTPHAVVCLSSTVSLLLSTGANQRILGSAGICNALVAMSGYATTAQSVARLTATLVRNDKEYQRTFGSPAMCAAVVAMSVYATTLESVTRMSTAIANLVRSNVENQRTFGTAAMCKAIVAMSVYATTPDVVERLSTAIANLVRSNVENQRTFGTAAMCKAIVAMSVYATTPDVVERLSTAIANLVRNNEENQCTFGTAAMCKAIVAMSVYATTPDAVERLSIVVHVIVRHHVENQRTFGTAAMFDEIIAMTVHATTPLSVRRLSTAIFEVVHNHKENQHTFATAAMRDALVSMSVYSTDPESAEALSAALTVLLRHMNNEPTFETASEPQLLTSQRRVINVDGNEGVGASAVKQ